MNQLFSSEQDSRVLNLRKRLDLFYQKTEDYTAFHESNYLPEFWRPIRARADEIVKQKGTCKILEFGAGCTGFSKYIQDIRNKVLFDVQDVTSQNVEYLSTQANHVHICAPTEIEESYDIIFSTFVWEHITNPQAVLSHLINILEPNGSIFIASPRYDFPFYMSPSIKHLSGLKRLKTGIWLIGKRLKVLLGGQPEFLIHLEPAVFYQSWFRDADAIHWVSIWDLKKVLPKTMSLKKFILSGKSLKQKLYFSFLLMFVELRKQD